ncbi:kinase-like domain-containing protein [Hyaloraphidium curvatum]|nr:kinase-like domain-containing protein [Hyaloraphidium curvatum]
MADPPSRPPAFSQPTAASSARSSSSAGTPASPALSASSLASAATLPPRGDGGHTSDAGIFAHGRRRRRVYRDAGKKLGKGAEAAIKTVVCTETGETFALKVVPKPADPARRAAAEKASRRRWDLLAPIVTGHPSMPYFKEGFETESKWYAAMELFPSSLAEYLASRGARPEVEARRTMQVLLSTLAHLHSQGAIHRDVKPANLLLRDPADPASLCLADLTSVYIGQPGGEVPGQGGGGGGSELSSTVTGTPFYLAPEAVKGWPYGAKVDVYSAGVLCYEMLFAHTPFQDATSWEDLFSRIAEGRFALPSSPAISPEARDFLLSMLGNDPALRPSAAEALAHPFLNPRGAVLLPPTPTPSLAPRDTLAPADDGFRTTFTQSGARVFFDEAEGVLRLSDPRAGMRPQPSAAEEDSGEEDGADEAGAVGG